MKNLKPKEQTEEDKRKDVARMTAKLARLDRLDHQEDARQEKLRKKREVKRKKL